VKELCARANNWQSVWRKLDSFKIDKLIDSADGLEIFITGTKSCNASYKIHFETNCGYRNFDEGELIKRWEDEGQLYIGIYAAETSKFLEWATMQSAHDELSDGIKHYAIVTSDDVVDVLSFDYPQITAIK